MIDTELWGRDPRFFDGSGAGSALTERLISRRSGPAVRRPGIDMAPVDAARRLLAGPTWKINFKLILDVTSYTFQVPRSKIMGPSRETPLPRARQALVWVARQVTDWSLHTLGDRLARDHSTICHANLTAIRLRESDTDFRLLTDAMLKVLEPYCAAKCGMETEHAG